MKKIRYTLFVLKMLFALNVEAEDHCDSKELARVKEIAKKVEFDYDYKMEDGKAVFSITAMNLNSDIKVLIIDNYYNQVYKEFKNQGNNKGTLNNFKEGERVTVTINAYVPNWCSGKKVLTKTIKLPYYNYYYSEEKCKGYEDFKYCKQLVDSKITEENFEKQLKAYINNKQKSVEVKKEEEESSTLKYVIIGVVSLIVAIGAVVLIVNNISRIRKKNSL